MAKKIIHIINGPNLNLLGKREPEIYGKLTFEGFFSSLKTEMEEKAELHYFQSNSEGELVTRIQEVGFSCDGIVCNAAAYTHTSIAIADAIAAISAPVIEVHISNVYARESFRHQGFMSRNCVGGIFGLGLEGYRLAVDYFLKG